MEPMLKRRDRKLFETSTFLMFKGVNKMLEITYFREPVYGGRVLRTAQPPSSTKAPTEPLM